MPGKKMPISDDTVLAGAGLRIRREQLGRSLEDVAGMIKKNRATVTRWEAGVNLDEHRADIRRAYGYYSERIAALAVHDAYGSCVDHDVLSAPSLQEGFRRSARGRGESVNNLMLAGRAVHGAAMEPMLLTLSPGESTGDAQRHQGEEFLYVVDGADEALHIDFTDPVQARSIPLKKGAFAHFRSDLPHRLRNEDKYHPVTVLVLKHPPDRYSRHLLEETASRIRQPPNPPRVLSRRKTPKRSTRAGRRV